MTLTFKDRLKAERKTKGISQQQLANAVFVSRSAVAKWENGLGLPSKASYDSLLSYFGLTADEFPLNEEAEAESVKRNRKVHVIRSIIFWVAFVALSITPIWMFSAIESGYAFTSEMAAGKLWADDECLHIDGYDIYYTTYKSDDEALAMIDLFCVVEDKLIGYQRRDIAEYKRGVYSDDGTKYGNLFTFETDTGYHHIFKSDIYMNESGTFLYIVLYDVEINGDIIVPYRSSYFVTDENIEEFYSANKHFTIK